MIKISQILSKGNKILLFKYILISICGYGFIFLGLYVLVDFLNLNETTAFMIVYAITYIYLYVVQLKYLFKTQHSWKKLVRFYAAILVFYILANIIYNLGLKLNINYLIASIISVVVLMPLRLIVSKLIVFKN